MLPSLAVQNPALLLVLKLVVFASWLVAAAGFFFPMDSGFGLAGRALFGLLALTHLIECAVFYRTLTRTGRPIGVELANTFVFGVVHFAEARALAEARTLVDAPEESR